MDMKIEPARDSEVIALLRIGKAELEKELGKYKLAFENMYPYVRAIKRLSNRAVAYTESAGFEDDTIEGLSYLLQVEPAG
jgi:hypothetical protein